ncbi:MAG: hypothetical protein QOH49_5096, partial [Acidobacteriota bacterium]|nr:hypothetical protein [Acidobacteriota bacterium]
MPYPAHGVNSNCYENGTVSVDYAAFGSASTVTFSPILSSLLISRCCCVRCC